jgi:hypothetical protein
MRAAHVELNVLTLKRRSAVLPIQDQINEVLPLLREDGSFDDILREFEETEDEQEFIKRVRVRLSQAQLSNKVYTVAQRVLI